MPDTTIREGVLWVGASGAVHLAIDQTPMVAESIQCVVVTGRTAQDVEKALATYDATRAWLARLEDEARRLRDA